MTKIVQPDQWQADAFQRGVEHVPGLAVLRRHLSAVVREHELALP
jgi:hypothetical protein